MASLNLLSAYGGSDSESDTTETEECLSRKKDDEVPTGGSSVTTKRTNFFDVPNEPSSSDDDTSTNQFQGRMGAPIENLKNPFRVTSSEKSEPKGLSVFANPFREAEEFEKSIIEKHVKLAPKLEDVKEINGRKICWNFRKGRCRFGGNCVFAHDSELLLASKQQELNNTTQCAVKGPDFNSRECHETQSQPRNKRPGLSQGIVPGKKVMRMYKKQQASEQPWKFTQ